MTHKASMPLFKMNVAEINVFGVQKSGTSCPNWGEGGGER